MRTFTRPIPVTAALQWLEQGRTNLFALVDPATAMAIKVGSLSAVEAHNKSKGRNKQWHIMSYPDIKAFHKASAPSPVANGKTPKPEPSPAPAEPASPVPSPVPTPAMAELTKVSEQLIESIVDARLKEAVELQTAANKGDLPAGSLALIAEIRKLEKHGLSVLAKLEQYNKHNPTWSQVGLVNFQQATMAMVKSLSDQ